MTVEIDFQDALYHFNCPVCGERVQWDFDPDVTLPNYTAFCCDHMFNFTPKTVEVTVTKEV